MKIYLVTSGSYDDFGIEVAFSTREKAEDFIRRVKAANNPDQYHPLRIFEMVLDDESERPKRL